MDVEIRVASSDELRNLRKWLLDEPEFRGRVTLREAPPRPGEMGPVVDALLLTFAAGGGAVLAATTVRTLGNVLITWLKSRTSQVEVTIRRTAGVEEVTLSASAVRGLSADGVARTLDELTARLGPATDGKGEVGEAIADKTRPELPAG